MDENNDASKLWNRGTEAFENQVMNAITKDSKKKPFPLGKTWLLPLVAAAALVLGVVAFFATSKPSAETNLSSASQEETLEFIATIIVEADLEAFDEDIYY